MFTVYGPGVTNPITLDNLFVRPAVTKTAAIAAKQAIKEGVDHGSAPVSAYRSAMGQQKYQVAERATGRHPSLKAAQLMTAPVTYVLSTTPVSELLVLLSTETFRHFPVLSSEQQLVGMVSDRDIVRCMCASDSVCTHCTDEKKETLVESVMKARVLSASVEADARHIARLFVEQRIGAMPITENNQLVGMITRSDILRAVMVNFDLNLWL